jgi:Fe-S cluster biogenesis protein NfuA
MNIDRIQTLIERAESLPDPNARRCTIELLQSLMEFHSSSLERLMAIVSAHGAAGDAIRASFVKDEAVTALLLLYGLHPACLADRVKQAIGQLQPVLAQHHATVELLSCENSVVRLSATMNGQGCQSSPASVKEMIEAAIIEAAPDLSDLIIEETASLPKPVLVPLQRLPVTKTVSNTTPG